MWESLFSVGLLISFALQHSDEILAVNDFDIMPGCYAASVPPIIAGYWYGVSTSGLIQTRHLWICCFAG
jgi:hypothetical protein